MQNSQRFSVGVVKMLLVLAGCGLIGTVIGGVGWVVALREDRVELDDLSVEDRQRLVEQFFQVSGRVYAPAWFEPAIAYTLRRNETITAWSDTFTSNDLGYRTGSVEKLICSDVTLRRLLGRIFAFASSLLWI